MQNGAWPRGLPALPCPQTTFPLNLCYIQGRSCASYFFLAQQNKSRFSLLPMSLAVSLSSVPLAFAAVIPFKTKKAPPIALHSQLRGWILSQLDLSPLCVRPFHTPWIMFGQAVQLGLCQTVFGRISRSFVLADTTPGFPSRPPFPPVKFFFLWIFRELIYSVKAPGKRA